MEICNAYEELSLEIKEKMTCANVFFGKEFYNFSADSCTDVRYIFNEKFIQVVVVHHIHKLFKTAVLPTEPFAFFDSKFDFYEQQIFLDDVMSILKKNFHVDWVTVTPANTLFKAYPSQCERIKFGNYILRLDGGDDEVFARITSKHRNMIRRGEKGGITVNYGGIELLSDYMLVDRQTWIRSGENVDHSEMYRRYLDNFGENVLIGVAYKDEVPQCGILGIYNEAMFYYMFGASADHPEPGSTHYLQWRTMQLLIEKKVKLYNFVGCRINVDAGSKYDNIQRFKKGFGGDLIECFLFKVTFNHLKKRIFDLLLRVKNGKLSSDVIDQEIAKWTEINGKLGGDNENRSTYIS